MAAKKRRTQRERAEAWARSSVWREHEGGLWLSSHDGKAIVLGDREHQFSDEAMDAIRAAIVRTWMRARRAKR